MTTNGNSVREGYRWIRADLHIHTPASEDYAEPNITYLEILQEAERRELEIIAFTDHNSVHGYEQMRQEIDFLQTLERAQRLTEDEQRRLNEYRRLLAKITVLPGFEFTSHFGAHILALFGSDRPVSLIEATLLQLGVQPDLLKRGACSVPDTRHVTDAYEIIARAGGLVVAAHANGPNGVITETLRMGTSGQARIAATQHTSLHALEFVNFYTDHEKFTSPSSTMVRPSTTSGACSASRVPMRIACAAPLPAMATPGIGTVSATATSSCWCPITRSPHSRRCWPRPTSTGCACPSVIRSSGRSTPCAPGSRASGRCCAPARPRSSARSGATSLRWRIWAAVW
ncbi:MAG: PHP domain-containing protein [Kouleothrix sp.]